MNIAAIAFMTGVLLAMVSMFRINVRIFQWAEARRPWKDRPRWDPLNIVLRMRLRDTLALEILALAIALLTIIVAIRFLTPVHPI